MCFLLPGLSKGIEGMDRGDRTHTTNHERFFLAEFEIHVTRSNGISLSISFILVPCSHRLGNVVQIGISRTRSGAAVVAPPQYG